MEVEELNNYWSTDKTLMAYCKYINTDKINPRNNFRQERVLGIIQFSNNQSEHVVNLKSSLPFLNVPIESYNHSSVFEIWYSSGLPHYTRFNNFQISYDSDYLFGCTTVNLGLSTIDEITHITYAQIFNILKELSFSSLIRIWHFIPYINEMDPNGIEQYKLFCLGRHKAFRNKIDYFKMNKFPAASAVGINDDQFYIYFIASNNADVCFLENPLQIPSFQYPKIYGIKPPLFSRAAFIQCQHYYQLYLSGTASVYGHESVRLNSLSGQFDVAMTNIESLISSNLMTKLNPKLNISMEDLKSLKAYCRNLQDCDYLYKLLRRQYKISCPIIFLRADICRPELLLEIEGIFHDYSNVIGIHK